MGVGLGVRFHRAVLDKANAVSSAVSVDLETTRPFQRGPKVRNGDTFLVCTPKMKKILIVFSLIVLVTACI